jgi:F0F1-type ATP synthase membrane subunit b/b'
MAKSVTEKKSIENLLSNKITSIKNQIDKLENELQQTQTILVDYNKNRTTIETILGLQSAPDVAAPRKRVRKS